MHEVDQIRLTNSMKKDSIEKTVQIIQELGKGTFARVFKARIKQTGQTLAVKQIGLLLDKESALKQVQYLQKIDNDHIVTYFSSIYDLTDQSLNIVMQLCQCSLRKQMLDKIYSQNQLIDFLVQMVSAFLELMNLKLMHLDLKPQNILISQGHQNYYKICDFGCSQIASKSKLSKYENDIFGTFNYLAPQNYLDYSGRFTNTSADIWSLGIIMYEMIYKNFPFKVGKDGLILRKDIELFFKEEKQIQFKVSVNSPKNITKILKQMLIKNPKKRITWRELQKWLIKEQKVEQLCFKNVRQTFFKHITLVKIFISMVVICRKNVEFNPYPLWKREQQLLYEFCEILVHLCYIYCIKFRNIYGYKINVKLQPQLRQTLQFVENNIEFQQKLISQKAGKQISVITDCEFYEMSLTEAAKLVKEKLQAHQDQGWLAMNDLLIFCNEIVRRAEVSPTFFAAGEQIFFKQSIQGLNIKT